MSLDLEADIDGIDTPTPEVEEDRKGFELIDGTWVEKGMGSKAAVAGDNVQYAVTSFVRQHRLGRVLNSEGGYRMFPNNLKLVRKPDVSFVAANRLPNGEVPDGYMSLAPDLAVEVVSPRDLAEPLEKKIDEYLAAGVRLVWVLYVPTKSVWVLKPDGTVARRKAGDQLTGDDVLPGFAVAVAELFDGV